MVADGTTLCSTRIRSLKEKKNWREICEYLRKNRIDWTQILRKVGCVLEVNMEALEQVERTRNAGQRQQQGVAVGCCKCGFAHPPRDKRGGDRMARRRRQRVNRGRSRDDCIVAQALAKSLNPFQGGSDSRDLATTSKLQILQQFSVAGNEDGKSIRSEKDQAIYVGISNPTDRLAHEVTEKKEEKDKKGQSTAGSKQNKIFRKVEDGLLMVVAARIYGKPVRALIDSGATRCFVTPACVTTVGLKGQPRDTFLELGNGEKFLSRGYVPDVPVVTAGLTVKIGLTVTNLLHEVDLVLGINWLQLVNPVVDWSGARLYVPNAVQTTLLQGNWLEGHMQAGTVTVLSSELELKRMKERTMQEKISVLKCPKFWREINNDQNLRTNFLKGDVKYEIKWGHLYKTDCDICKRKNECKGICKHRTFCKLYVMNGREGEIKMKRVNKNAMLPSRGTSGAAGYDLAAAEAAVVRRTVSAW